MKIHFMRLWKEEEGQDLTEIRRCFAFSNAVANLTTNT
jgi:hypothetical protein